MKRSMFTEEQIAFIVKQATDGGVGRGPIQTY